MPIERGSAKHGARADDRQKNQMEAVVRGGGPTRMEEWREAEPTRDLEEAMMPKRYPPGHEPGTPEGLSSEDVERRSYLARWLSDAGYPAGRADLLAHAQAKMAPDSLVETIDDLPDESFRNVGDVAKALGIGAKRG